MNLRECEGIIQGREICLEREAVGVKNLYFLGFDSHYGIKFTLVHL